MTEAMTLYENMKAVFQEKTGILVADSADLAVRLYAAAAQLESLYGYCDWALRQSFPQTATGDYLDLHAQMRQLSRKEEAQARGTLEFYLPEALEQAVTVPRGTVATNAALVRFVTTEDGVIPAGSLSCQVSARAEEAGESGNAPAGTVTLLPQTPAYVQGCGNSAAFTGGQERETDEELRARVLKSFRHLSNGANLAFYETWALQYPGVEAVRVLPKRRGAGTVDILVCARGGVPSEELLEQMNEEILSLREIATDVQVFAPQTAPVSVDLTIYPREEVTFSEAEAVVRRAVEDFFGGALLGKTVYLTQLGHAVYATGMVRNYVLTGPTADVSVEELVLPVLENLTVTEGE